MGRPKQISMMGILVLVVVLIATGCSDAESTGGDWGGSAGGGGGGISTGGAQDFGYFRQTIEAGGIPRSTDIDEQGFFAEHATPLPAADCGELICPHAMLGVMDNLLDGSRSTLLQLGMNSVLSPAELPRLPLNLAIVVDVSGSMGSEGKLLSVQNGLEVMIDALEDEDTISIITYSDSSHVVLDSMLVEDNRYQIREVVRAFTANGGTNFYAGLEAGYSEVFENFDPENQNRVILLSDGQPTVGTTDSSTIIDMSRAYNSEGVGLTTIGVGFAFNEQLMRELAEQGNGNYYFVDSDEAAVEVFIEEVEFFTTSIAEDLMLTMHPGEGYRITNVYGTNMWEPDGDGGTIRIPSVFLAHRQAHDDNDRGRRGGGSAILIELEPRQVSSETLEMADVGKTTLSFRPTIDTATWGSDLITLRVDAWYPEEAQSEPEVGYFANQFILKSFVMLDILKGFRMASDLYYAGSSELARAIIDGLADRVEEINIELDDADITDDLRLLRLFAANLQAR